MVAELLPDANPYVGPRTFTRAESSRFFGREREARELLSLVISQRLVLFYAQSGAGKSSLLNTRLAPQLEAAGFVVLPTGRVGGALPADVGQVANAYLFSLMLSLDQDGGDPARLARLDLADFLAHLTSDDGQSWRYDRAAGTAAADDAAAYVIPNTVLIIDQFEEILTTHADRWPERATFFTQLDRALQADPHLWVVLTLREDYVAALDPYAPLLTDKLRARYYMERMGVDAALDAIRRPADLGGRPFAPGVAEKLVDDLRQVRVPGHDATVPGQYVEPVQLQVVCFQLWARLLAAGVGGQGSEDGGQGLGVGDKGPGVGDQGLGVGGQYAPVEGSSLAVLPVPGRMITEGDLGAAGEVNQALEQFYADTLAAVLGEPAVQPVGVSERALRTWFDRELLTEGGIRSTVLRNEATGRTGSLPNAAVDALARRFLLRSELRGGGTWVELVHDRFVEPIRTSNAAWFPANLSTLQRQADLWHSQGRPDGLLLRGDALVDAETWATQAQGLQPHEQEFLAACQAERALVEREQRQSRRIRMLFVAAVIVSILAMGAAALAWNQTQRAQTAEKRAVDNAVAAEARMAQVGKLVDGLGIERLLSLAGELDRAGDTSGATTLLQTAVDLNPAVLADLDPKTLNADALRLLAFVSLNDKNGGEYAYIPAGEFTMGSDARDSLADDDEKPAHQVDLAAYWIGRTEVTNAQYARCVEARVCDNLPYYSRLYDPRFAKRPVTHVDWDEAKKYAEWVGGRLPSEAEWEKACRGADGRIYPWGNEDPSSERLNYNSNVGDTTEVGRYPAGEHGLYDMAGNAWEWTADWYGEYYYAHSPPENPTGPAGGPIRTLRGGWWESDVSDVRCAGRSDPYEQHPYSVGLRVVGIRVVLASPGF